MSWNAQPGVWRAMLEFLLGEKVVYSYGTVFDLRTMPPGGMTMIFR